VEPGEVNMTTPTAPPPLPDGLFMPLMLRLRDCLDHELGRSLAGPTCRMFLHWRQTPPVMDGCHCNCAARAPGDRPGNGDGWVRFVELTADPGTGSFERGRNNTGNAGCAPGMFLTVALGYYRCIPVGEEGKALAAAQETTITALMASDMAACLRVIYGCCDAFNHDLLPQGEKSLPVGPPTFHRAQPIRAADCGGGEVLIRVPLLGAVKCQ
jgi:hypothetical protein